MTREPVPVVGSSPAGSGPSSSGPSSSGTAPRTREAIVVAAAEVFARRGYAATTVGDLAVAAGVTRPTVYAHFGTKAEVFRALTHAVRDEFLAAQAVTDVEDPVEIARRVVTDYLDVWTRHLRLLEVVAHQSRSDPEVAAAWREVHERAHRRNTRFVERLAREGRAHPVIAPERTSEAITGIVRRFAERAESHPDERAALATDAVAAYLRIVGLSP